MTPFSSILQIPVVAIYGGGAISAAGLAALLRNELIEVTIPERADAGSVDKGADVVLLAGLAHTEDPAGLARRHDAAVLLLVDRPLTLESTLQLGAAGSVCRECSAERLTSAVHTIAAGGTYFECDTHPPRATPLSARERRVATELARGSGIEEIATALCISPHTARTHIRNIRRKLGARTSAEAVARAITLGLVVLSAH